MISSNLQIQLINFKRLMHTHQKSDVITETTNSLELQSSFWQRFKLFICPCLNNSDDKEVITNQANVSKISETGPSQATKQKHNYHWETNEICETSQYDQNFMRMSHQVQDFKFGMSEKDRKTSRESAEKSFKIKLNKNAFPIESLPENQLISIGIASNHLLVKTSSVFLDANSSVLRKEMFNPLNRLSKKNVKKESQIYSDYEFDKFWNQRYLLFEKFDEGIKVEEGSWEQIPYEAVSDFIAHKCCGSKVVIDAFSGVGGTAIRIAGKCSKVITNNKDKQKVNCLINNTKVYEVQKNVEIRKEGFMTFPEQKSNIDIIFVNPPLGKRQIDSNCVTIFDFQPSLDKIITKSIKLSSNLLMLLPPQICLQPLCSFINKSCAQKRGKFKDSCSIKVEKIIFRGQMKHILVSFGNLVKQDIKLSEELDYFYRKLKKSNEKTIKHRKVIKKLREDYGMIELLNILKEAEKNYIQNHRSSQVDNYSSYLVDEFYKLIKSKKLIIEQKLQKLLQSQDLDTSGRTDFENSMNPMMEQQKTEDGEEIEGTLSTNSYYSYFSKMENLEKNDSKSSKIRDSNGSVLIKRITGESKERNSPSPKSPLTPKNKNKNLRKSDSGGMNLKSCSPQKKYQLKSFRQ